VPFFRNKEKHKLNLKQHNGKGPLSINHQKALKNAKKWVYTEGSFFFRCQQNIRLKSFLKKNLK
jgi:hypothetical protein